ncbi:fused MFS/spermidine synthase [Methylomonas sp. SURF-2]|uniref:Fused MFS/spermidine synthase n=1 Tax=Methylomonas subterranea TaxID=2952225 RepID=A0ABT1TFV7_9GAMM|nr:fused MFS/spermidine synthase [Methylomonas sp. SURF-2]MCQ8103952.1 fused MFS/spermidine synthase [Methylomonas sp. SURF-2]
MNTTPQTAVNSTLSPVILFAGTLFVSAMLMFVLQPMFGKLLLPLLGGTPAVWNTCMVFYQTILFGGYGYAHWLSSRSGQQRQIQIHTALLIFSLFALPVALPDDANPPTEGNPTFWLIWTLFLSIGLPFFVVSATAPLLQKWFSHLGHHSSEDPYYLYAASNAGSLLALLSYPFLLEPNIGLADQRLFWSMGYGLLCILIIICAVALWCGLPEPVTGEAPEEQAEQLAEPPFPQQLHWLALAFVPSSLLLGLTQYISTDIAAVPLLWILPLTLYLLSFILVFSKWADRIHPGMLALQPAVLLIFIAYSFINPALLPYWLDLILHCLAFFLAIMVCHGELAKLRPHTQHLTRFYLVMSFAGMLGGLFNTFVAPFAFNAVYEYPIMIVAALFLRPGFFKGRWYLQAIFPGLLLLAGLALYLSNDALFDYLDIIGGALILLAGLTYSVRQGPLGLGSLTAVILIFSLGLHSLASSTLYQERTFFGVLSVRDTVIGDENQRPEKVRELYHGTTKHGAQRLTAANLTTPLTYYSRPGPIGQLFAEFDAENQHWNIGAVGLGAGALACYAKPQQHWRFYEIDPLIVDVAKDPKWFHYLERCKPDADMIIGDARLSLQKEPDQGFDLLIMDAFSSDAVPTHLLTREAMQLYFSKLKDDGILAFHITNRHLALKKVLADHAESLRLSGLLQEFKPENPPPLVVATDWVVIAKQTQRLDRLRQSRLGHWQKLPLTFDLQPWTDDFTHIIGIWK